MVNITKNVEEKMKKKFLYIANWKSYLPYQQAVQWCTQNATELTTLKNSADIIICPDFLALPEAQKILTSISVGAQNCSAYETGAYTGEVSAQSLKEAGIDYCIIGHSERRRIFGETAEIVAQKMGLLLHNGITPVVCLSDEWESELEPVMEILSASYLDTTRSSGPLDMGGEKSSLIRPLRVKLHSNFVSRSEAEFIIAYEPVSAIGTGNVPSNEKIEKTVTLIKEKFTKNTPDTKLTLLYGGSVNAKNSGELKQIPILDGFLIGKASTDFQELKNIILAKP